MLPQGRNQGRRRACVPGPVLIPEHKTQAERGHIGGETCAGHLCSHLHTRRGQLRALSQEWGPGTTALLSAKAVLLNGLSSGVPFTSQSPSAWGEGGTWGPSAGFALCAAFDSVRMATQL